MKKKRQEEDRQRNERQREREGATETPQPQDRETGGQPEDETRRPAQNLWKHGDSASRDGASAGHRRKLNPYAGRTERLRNTEKTEKRNANDTPMRRDRAEVVTEAQRRQKTTGARPNETKRHTPKGEMNQDDLIRSEKDELFLGTNFTGAQRATTLAQAQNETW